MDMSIVIAQLIALVIAFAIPLATTAYGAMFSERSGVINIGLEGTMVFGAFGGCLVSNLLYNYSPLKSAPFVIMLIAIIVAAIFGGLASLLLGLAAIKLKSNQVITGTAINMFLTSFCIVATWALMNAITGTETRTILVNKSVRMITPTTFGVNLDYNGLGDAGKFFYNLIFSNFFLVNIVIVILIVIFGIILYKTRFGLRLRACGENPSAAASVGIDVNKYRWAGTVLGGVFAGLGGLSFIFAQGSAFESSVSGFGFLALAILIFGNWNPIRICAAALFFAFFRAFGAMSGNFQFLTDFKDFLGMKDSVNSFYLMIPYILTLVVLILTSKKSQAPKAEGIPYDKSVR